MSEEDETKARYEQGLRDGIFQTSLENIYKELKELNLKLAEYDPRIRTLENKWNFFLGAAAVCGAIGGFITDIIKDKI